MKDSISPKNVNDIVLNEVLFHAKTKDKLRILEIGAGKGVFIQALSTRLEELNIGCQIYIADIEPEQINDRNIGIKCQFLDAQKEFKLDGKYDVIIAIELIEHIENPFHFIREIAKNINKNGMLLLTSPNVISLRSRARYFLTGCTDYFRRPYNEYWLNMGHINPINPLQLVFLLRKNGFEVSKITSNATTFESMILAPFVILISIFSFFHYILREKGKIQKTRNMQLLKFVLSPALLLGKTAIYKSIRKTDLISTPDVWHRSDENFDP